MVFNDIIVKELLNEYAGSEKKKTVLFTDGNKYLLKLPDPTREQDLSISYINNAFSEYIGCKIAKSIGLDVQDVLLGIYIDKNGNEKVSCACRDLCNNGYRLREIDTISNSLELDSTDLKKITLENSEKIIEAICPEQSKDLINAYYDMFILDAFIGNTDRHNGNWAVLVNDQGDIKKCPIYDCGSCLLPLVDNKDIETTNIEQLHLSLTSAITENGKRIAYGDFISSTHNDNVKAALKRIIPRINLTEIFSIIDESEYIPDIRKNMYKNIIKSRYEKILIVGLENCFPLEETEKIENVDYLEIYHKYIKAASLLPLYENKRVVFNSDVQNIEFQRISNRYGIFVKNDICVGLLPIRSNNSEVRKAIVSFSKQGLEINQQDFFKRNFSHNIANQQER